MTRITMKSISMLITTCKLDLLHRVVWLPPASSSVDSTFESMIDQTFPNILGDDTVCHLMADMIIWSRGQLGVLPEANRWIPMHPRVTHSEAKH